MKARSHYHRRTGVARALLGLLLSVAMGLSGVAWARDDVEASKAHYESGVRHYDVSEYQQALDDFKDAYRNKPDPVFLYNIAQCHRKLGQTDEAIELYQSYLRRAPEAANRDEVERRIHELRSLPRSAPTVSPASPSSPAVAPPSAPAVEHAASTAKTESAPVGTDASGSESSPSPTSSALPYARLLAYAGTDFPVDLSVGLAAELGQRFRLATSVGFLPSAYASAMNSLMVLLGAYDQNTADLIRDTLKSSFVWRTHVGVFPFLSHGLYVDLGYGLVALGGGATAGEILSLSTGLALPTDGPRTGKDFDVAATLHMVDVEIGWRIEIGQSFVVRPAIGGAFTLANTTSVSPKYVPGVAKDLTTAFCDRSAAYLHDTLAHYAQLPVLSLHLGYRFY